MAQVLEPEVRDRIEAAAVRCFAEQGYAATSMAAIAAAAGTATANTYRYFASKRALFDAVGRLPGRCTACHRPPVPPAASTKPVR